MHRHGWEILFHQRAIEQLQRLRRAHERAQRPNANSKLYETLAQTMLDTVALDPSRPQYRQGNTLGPRYRHWRRAKIGRRFRVFFRYDSHSKIIVYAWTNDAHTLRAAGSKTDPYAVFHRLLQRGEIPNDWSDLVETSQPEWPDGENQ